ncbi:MAG: ligase-associated DNA damage response DEXH box helicase [Pseudomonadota bacterium]
MTDQTSDVAASLPPQFQAWFDARGWAPRPHQLDLLARYRAGRSTLLIAPTGAGKTLAGFLPSLTALTADDFEPGPSALHTLYISPLKALAVDVARNLLQPVEEMGLSLTIETRTGDTPVNRRQRQRLKPPQILLTTPEQIALMLAHDEAQHLFGSVKLIVLDELHALAPNKRGDLLALDIARLRRFAPDLRLIGLSATVAYPTQLRAYLEPQTSPDAYRLADVVQTGGGADPQIEILTSAERLPWSGHTCRYAMPEVYAALKAHRLTLVFVNTRSQAEAVFQDLWRINDDNLPIALHHGSLDVAQRRKVEQAMTQGRLRAVVATSTLDLGIDWGDVDLVVNIGAPKGASRLLQRIGRANHRLDDPSRAILVPANRFEVLECRAALDAARNGEQDAVTQRVGGLDVLAQHVLGCACHAAFRPEALFEEVTSAAPYAGLERRTFERVVSFVATGGYALKSYERYARIKPTDDGHMRLAHPRFAQQYRMNVGTIVEAPMIKVRLTSKRAARASGRGGASTGSARTQAPAPRALVGGRVMGELEEWFIEQLAPGDTFLFGGEVLRLEGLRDTDAYVSRAPDRDPMVPSYQGGKFPLSTHLATRVRHMLADGSAWPGLPEQVHDWLDLQLENSVMPAPHQVLVETFPRGNKHHLVVYAFEGRLAHQTLGMLLTRRLDRAGARPLGFVANDYAFSIWGMGNLNAMVAEQRLDIDRLFDEDMLGDDLDAWLADSMLMKRTFRYCAVIAGLIERKHPGKEKSGRQVTISSDLIYDVLRQHEPDHILLEAAWADAATGLLDIARLGEFLHRIAGNIVHQPLQRVSPLAVPVMLEIGREPVLGTAREDMMRLAADELLAEAVGEGTGDAGAQT